jgi:threonylcarbamoyladenosine tRNA methylthiotransferase MtaB
VDKKSMQYIRRARRANPNAFVAVCGCMANGRKETFPEGVDLLFDTRAPEGLLEALAVRHENREPNGNCMETPPPQANRTRAFLKVQDGCDRFCAYCIVPYVRGEVTGMPMDEVLHNVNALVQQGTKEIVLTGIQLAAYGKDSGEGKLPGLIRNISLHAPGLYRLRLSSIDPWVVDDEFLQAVADTKILCSHFHLSLQSGCDATLARMNRRYTTDGYARAVAALRKVRPGAAVTTDVIVGFPGETAADFNESLSFTKEMGFARVHVFPYSPRAGTKAVGLPGHLPDTVKKARNAEMLALAARLKKDFFTAQVGRVTEILMETPTQGHTGNYCLVHLPNSNPITPNTVATVRITGHGDDHLNGEIIHG